MRLCACTEACEAIGAEASFTPGDSLAETVRSASPYAMKEGWGQGVGRQTHGAECEVRAAGNSFIDGSGASPAAAGSRAGSSLVTPLGAVGGSIGVVLLEQSTRLGSPLPVFHSSMPCACARGKGPIGEPPVGLPLHP